MIHILDHQTDEIVDFYSNKKKLYWDDVHFSSLENYEAYFDFKTLYNNSESIQQRNRVIIPDEDGFFHEFIITETLKNDAVKEVFTIASFVEDLKKEKTINPQKFQGETVNSFLDKVLDGTGWQRGKTDYLGIRTIAIDNPTYPFNVLKSGASIFEGELNFRIETKGNRITGRFVDLVERIGDWNGKEITVGKDLIGVKRRETSEEIATALLCLGPEREDGTRLTVEVTDEDARKRWGRPANNPQHLYAIYEPQTADQDMSEERLRSLGKTELAKRINSVVEYEADQASIEHIFGFQHEKVRKGDTVRIKDTSYTPALYLEARVKSVQRSLSDPSQKKYILGDFIEYTEEDVMALFRSMQRVLSQKISEQQLLSYAEKIIPEQPTPPDPVEHLKWVDTSGEIPQMKLWDGTDWTTVKGDPGEPGPNIVDENTQFGANWLVAEYIKSLNGLNIGDGQFTVDENGNVSIANDRVLLDILGVTVKDGSFFLEDNTTDTKYSIVPRTNLINDHSFEMITRGAHSSGATYLVPTRQDFFYQWGTFGAPRLMSALQSSIGLLGMFGYQAALVRNSDYFRQSLSVMPNQIYTVSAYFRPDSRVLGVAPRLLIRHYGFGDVEKNRWDSIFPEILDQMETKRHSLTFTTPSNFESGDYFTLSVLTGDSRWAVVDGVQVVEGSSPVMYDPEIQLFNFFNAIKGSVPESMFLRNLELQGKLKIMQGGAALELFTALAVDNAPVYVEFNNAADKRYGYFGYGGSDGVFTIRNEIGNSINLRNNVTVTGSHTVSGTKSAVVETESYGMRKMYSLETPDSRFVTYMEMNLEVGEHVIEIEPMFLETINGFFVVPHIQNNADVSLLERNESSFKVLVEKHSAEVVFEVNGKRRGYEDVYMEEFNDEAENAK